MIWATRAPQTFARRMVTPTYPLLHTRFPFAGETHGIKTNNRQSFQSYPRLTFSTNVSKLHNRDTADVVVGATNGNQDSESNLIKKIKKNIFQRMFKKYSVSEQKNRILMAESLFQAATSQASDPRWYGPGRIGRDFRSYQAVLTLHIWLLHKRLLMNKSEPHSAALIQEELFDIFWIDSSNRMRAHGVNEMLINKNLKKVQQYSFMHMFHYDHCYTGELFENPTDRLEALKMTIKTHILLLPSLLDESEDTKGSSNDNDEPIDDETFQKHLKHDEHAERIAWYIETQFQNIIYDLPDTFFEKARIAWVDLPSFDHMIDSNTGKELPKRSVDSDDTLPLDWTKSIANDGTYYYWNLKTREALWERPE